MESYDIVIVDSGLNIDSKEHVRGIVIKRSLDGFVFSDDMSDETGHGTVIYSVIRKHSPKSTILMVKIFDEQHIADEEYLIYTLSYIKESIRCKIINLSLGIKTCNDVKKLHKVCTEINALGTVIVSAFDNEGCNSFPAALDNVIGVDNKNEIKNIFDFEYVEKSPVNIMAKGNIQRIKLNSGKTVIVSGSSIACAYVTTFIANHFIDKRISHNEVLILLKSSSSRIYQTEDYSANSVIMNTKFKIQKAAVFPFSKEMHAFLRFKEMLPFNIKHYYDVRYSGRVGMQLSKFYIEADDDLYIEDIENAMLDDIDSIIIGHLDELNNLLNCDYRKKLILQALERGINIYSFDPVFEYSLLLSDAKIKYFYPIVSKSDVPQNAFGKLYKICKPVVGIFGTSSQQGKFSLQLTLKRLLEENGYKVGTIGTEPHALLFNMDYVYPIGYNSTVFLNPQESIIYLNNLIFKLCLSDCEIILTASQSQSVPNYYYNILDFPIKQQAFAMGIKADAIILCVNIFDDTQYIKNTIQVLEGLSDSSVIALVLYPMTYTDDWRSIYHQSKRNIGTEEFEKASVVLYDKFKIPVFKLGDVPHMLALYQCILDFF